MTGGGAGDPSAGSGRGDWHVRSGDEVLASLSTNMAAGLGRAEAAARLARFGANELRAVRGVSPWAILLEQFQNVLVVILLLAVALSALLGHALEAAAITVIVLFAVFLGFLQEFRAERALEALREMAAPTATVIRDGEEGEIAARELVPGDILLLGAGDRVPADGRLVETFNLEAEEASLTGESLPVGKDTATLAARELPVGDRRNLVFAGTTITYGRGRAVVVATGADTEFGQIARLLQKIQPAKTPLQENLDRVGRNLARAALAIVAVVVVLGLLRGQPALDMLLFGVALAVAVVPEALPAVVTISLAIGVQRMARRHALVRRLPAVETLGCTSVICSDKTGTLTRDEMTVRRIAAGERIFEVTGSGYVPHGAFLENGRPVVPDEHLLLLLRAVALCSDAHLVRSEQAPGGAEEWTLRGDPTEGGLVVAAAKAGLHKADLEDRFPRVAEIPFTSETKRMTTLHRSGEELLAFSKGAPEILLDSCTAERVGDATTELTEEARHRIAGRARQMGADALRVLAVSYRTCASIDEAERSMTFLGLLGMIDPPRPEASAAIRTCEASGIKTVMITGDHPVTAEAVARELGILRDGRLVTGPELDAMDDAQLERAVERIDAYARVSPEHKLRVVGALQARGHCVAMTGDGVNDAPALKKAEIGIAMGITGTDVTKEAAAMTLTDDNFASIVAAVEEGRAVFDNVKKYLMYLLSSNIGEIGLMLGAALLGLPLPLSAVQLLYVNLATDGLPALALAVDPRTPDLMQRRPRNPRAGVFTRPVVTLMMVGGLWSTLANLSLFAWALRSGRPTAEAMTMTFVSLVLIQLFKAYNYRSDRESSFHRPLANRWLNLAVAWEVLLLGAILYVPFLSVPFGTYRLTSADWAILLAVSATVFPVLEAAKWMERRGWFGELS